MLLLSELTDLFLQQISLHGTTQRELVVRRITPKKRVFFSKDEPKT